MIFQLLAILFQITLLYMLSSPMHALAMQNVLLSFQ